MNKKIFLSGPTCLLLAAAIVPSVSNAGVTYKDGDKYIKIGARIQMQYHMVDPDVGEKTDEIFFRRLRPYIEGSLHKNWKGKIQWDMGKASGSNEMSIKDAYMQYKSESGTKISIGNKQFPFSREDLTSSKKQQLVERTFVGDHNYGTPDRNMGVHFEGKTSDKLFSWGAAITQANIDPDKDKLDFDTPANKNSDFNEGFMAGGRVEMNFGGGAGYSQGDFSGNSRSSIAVGAYSWSNDDDNNTAAVGKPDIDSVTGLELSGAYRGNGLSVDAQINSFDADTVDSTITSGMYENGTTTLTSAVIEAGYMVLPNTLELVLGYQTQDADNYADAWNRTSVGANWFISKHDIKVQLSYRVGENLKGVTDADENELFIQTQFVF
ncbi:MAG: porin [Gammaproteobacteria bacterium]|nr:porin [Gammaproteobacteria bacterium]